MAKIPTKMVLGGQVLIQILHHSYNPKYDAHHLAHGREQRDGLEDRTCKSVHQHDIRAT